MATGVARPKAHGHDMTRTVMANLKDIEPKTSPNVTTYKGQALIVVRSGKKAGKATITATSTQFKGIGRQNITIK